MAAGTDRLCSEWQNDARPACAVQAGGAEQELAEAALPVLPAGEQTAIVESLVAIDADQQAARAGLLIDGGGLGVGGQGPGVAVGIPQTRY